MPTINPQTGQPGAAGNQGGATDVGGNVGTGGSGNTGQDTSSSTTTGQDVSPSPPQATNPNPGTNVPVPSDTSSGTGYSIKFTQGWWMTIGVVTAMLLGNVPYLGPLLFGILGLALLYQISQLIQGQ